MKPKFNLLLPFLFLALSALLVPRAMAVSPNIVISQVYGGAGCGTAGCSTYQNDFIEIFNRGSSPVSVNGWSVQYAAATGTTWQVTNLPNVSIPAGGYLLVAEASGANGVSPLPTPDVTGTIAMSATAGKVALVNNTTALVGACPGGATIVDFVGYGATANCSETANAPAPSTTTADVRGGGGCTETDNNSTDFQSLSPNPRNSATPLQPCSGATPTPTVSPTPTATTTPTPSPTATATPGAVRIHDIQGAAHLSPMAGQAVANVPGIVTATFSNGFYLQDPNPDANDATSEGVFVFTSSAPTVNVGDAILVGGTVSEFRAGGAGSTNLTITEIGSPTISVQSTGNPLPAPTVIGTGGHIPPTTVIEDDASGSVETSGVFDPASDGIDFYESLEAMRVQINNAVAVGPTSSFAEIPVLSDDGANASIRTTRGGIVVRATDFNPERVLLADGVFAVPTVHVGDHFSGPIVGVLDYTFGNFKLKITQFVTAVPAGLAQETTAIPTATQLAIATFNVENLDPGDPPAKFAALASLIVNNLRSPDLIAVEEIQDNNGPTNDSVVDATVTFNTLISAIQSAGGPTYVFRQINPVDDQDGGEPGGNIRVGFLFRTDRGLAFTDRAGGCSTCATTVGNGPSGVELSFSPGRVDPTNSAFNASRKPLAGEFTFNGQKLFVIGNHFNSKGGDDPLFGRFQPPTLSSETQRNQQAQIVNNFVDSILALNANAKIVVLGDLN
ncbi:MAG: lamin tail domain-containing protein, partial [Chthoniobacterales bacterium]